jgi:hypothetical protein
MQPEQRTKTTHAIVSPVSWRDLRVALPCRIERGAWVANARDRRVLANLPLFVPGILKEELVVDLRERNDARGERVPSSVDREQK